MKLHAYKHLTNSSIGLVLLAGLIPTGKVCSLQAENTITPAIGIACKDTLRKDTLKTVKLNGVTVTSSQKIHKSESDVYIPTTLQKRMSMDGYDLLRNMAIPQLDIDVLRNVTKSHGKPVTFVVDGHIVTNLDDIKQLSPRDILKVEYNGMPTGEYAQYDCIVAFTTKRRDGGGNIMIGGQQALNKKEGDYNGIVRFYRHRNEHSFSYSESYSNDDDSYITQSEHFVYPNGDELNKDLSSDVYGTKNRKRNLFYNYHYYGDSVTLNLRAGCSFRRPEAATDYQTDYMGRFSKSALSQERSDERSYSPYFSFSGNFKLGKEQNLRVRGSLNYSHSRYNYLLKEGDYENTNNSKENFWRFVVGGAYIKSLRRNWKIMGSLFNFTNISHTHYLLNAEPVKGELSNSETLYELGASKHWSKLYASLDGGVSQLYYKTEGQKMKLRYSPRAELTLKYTFTPHLYLQYRGEITNSYPTMDLFNNIEQDVDTIQKRRGNPNMKPTTFISNRLDVNYDLGHWSFYAMYDMFISWKNNGEHVDYEDGYFIHSNLTEGHYYYTNPEIGMGYSNHGLLLKTRFGLEHYQVTGRNGVEETEWYDNSSVSYSVKSLSIGLYYTTYRHGVYATLKQWSSSVVYGMTVSYNYKGLSVRAGVQNPFTDYKRHEVLLCENYTKHRFIQDNLQGKYLYVKLAYSLNFGNKKHKYSEINNNDNFNSAILKSGL